MNLLANAIQAIEGEGCITLQTEWLKDEVLISVTDTGCGMSEETQKRVFEPFFTTKEVGQGTGLGLSISFGIVEKHKGQMRVESKLGEGSRFEVRIPMQQL
jgi:two-component system, NtrC family, sensor kinase